MQMARTSQLIYQQWDYLINILNVVRSQTNGETGSTRTDEKFDLTQVLHSFLMACQVIAIEMKNDSGQPENNPLSDSRSSSTQETLAHKLRQALELTKAKFETSVRELKELTLTVQLQNIHKFFPQDVFLWISGLIKCIC